MKEKKEFRIVEYKDYFTIQQKQMKDTFFFLFGIGLWQNGKIAVWKIINKKGQFVDVYNIFKVETDFKTKEDALQWIEDYNKYPIYHTV